MSIWNKILLGLIVVASLGFFHAATRTVKTYKYWAELASDRETKLKEVRTEIVSLKTATHEHPRDDKTIGVEQLRMDLGRVLANRGRIWKCERQKAAATPADIMNVTLSSDESAPFAKNMLFYAFSEGDDQSPGKYLGEFRVDAVSDKQVVLASTAQMVKSPPDSKVKSLYENVLESKGTWVLYEIMPTDEHEALANLSEDQRKWLSDATEYVNDGQPIDAGGRLSHNSNDKKFERPLRDYLAIFRSCEMHRTLFTDRMQSAIRDVSYLTAAGKEATNLEALAEGEKTEVAKELQRAKTEQAAVAGLLAKRQDTLKTIQGAVQKAIDENVKGAQIIARLQKEAADLIDRRTRNMAQLGPGPN